MATNPRIPDRRDDKELKLHLRQNAPKSGAPWVPIALIVAAVLLIALIAFLPRAPKATQTPSAAEVPPQPTGQQIQFTNIKLVPAPVGSTVALDAIMTNAGGTDITGVAVDGKFLGQDGRILATQRAKVMGIEGNTTGDTQDLTQAPVKPNSQRPVRMVFDQVPQGWNHELPGLTVVMVTAAGDKSSANGVSPNVKGTTVTPQSSDTSATQPQSPK